MREKIIGILGGMGPEATLDLAAKIMRLTPAEKEQDHCRLIIDSNPKIENRTEAVFSGKTENVIGQLSETARNLEKAGADFILVPCNTAHYFLEDIRKSVKIEVLDMLRETADFISKVFRHIRKAGVLGTTATCGLNLHGRALSEKSITSIVPDGPGLDRVMRAITMIKEGNGHGRARIILAAEAQKLVRKGAEIVIAGCTEIPLALKPEDIKAPLVDPSEIIAAEAVRRVKGKSKSIRM